jgi:hypothetical protein
MSLVPAYTVLQKPTVHGPSQVAEHLTATEIGGKLKEKKRMLAEAKANFIQSMDKLNENLQSLKE